MKWLKQCLALVTSGLLLASCGAGTPSSNAAPPAAKAPASGSEGTPTKETPKTDNLDSGNNYTALPPLSNDHTFQGKFTASTANASGTADLDCRDFASQSEAQIYFNSKGGSSTKNVDALDWNHNGVPCEVNENWAKRSQRWPTPSKPTPPVITPTPPVVTPTPPVVAPGNGGQCYVNGYTTKKGTHVSGYYRRC